MSLGAIFPRTVTRYAKHGPYICKHGHDMMATGFYFGTRIFQGKAYTVKACRLCRIKAVQDCKARKQQALAMRMAAE